MPNRKRYEGRARVIGQGAIVHVQCDLGGGKNNTNIAENEVDFKSGP